MPIDYSILQKKYNRITPAPLSWLSVFLATSLSFMAPAQGETAPQIVAQTGQIPPRSQFRGIGLPERPPYYPATFVQPSAPLAPPLGTRIPNEFHWVYVNGDSPLLLTLVQQIEPEALVRVYQGKTVIDAGVFTSAARARQRQEQLRSYGIESILTTIHGERDFGTPSSPQYVWPVAAVAVPASQFYVPAPGYVPVQPMFPGVAPSAPSAIGYQVYADSRNGLGAVQGIEPRAYEALIGDRVVIYAGTFTAEWQAQQRVQDLASRGIAAEIILIDQPVGGVPQVPSYPGQVPSYPGYPGQVPLYPGTVPANYYFVKVPASPDNFTRLTDRLMQLGVPGNSIIVREWPGDPHIVIGPFANNADAQQWETYLRSRGLNNVRIHFGR